MTAYFIKADRHRKPHVIAQGLKSVVGTIYQTSCGQIIRWHPASTDVAFLKPGEVRGSDVCGICRRKTKQAIA